MISGVSWRGYIRVMSWIAIVLHVVVIGLCLVLIGYAVWKVGNGDGSAALYIVLALMLLLISIWRLRAIARRISRSRAAGSAASG
jgi:hypothetical protein